MAERRAPPPGLDYVPVPGRNSNLIFGVIRTSLGGVTNTALNAVFKRLFPVNRPDNPHQPWPKPSCYRYDVLLPPGAPNDYVDPEVLCRADDKQGWKGLKDLIVITTMRFPETVADPPTLTLAEAYERARAFAYARFCSVPERRLAVILAFHVPAHAGVEENVPHCHLMALSRRVSAGSLGFGELLSYPLATDAGRQIIDDEYDAWRLAGSATAKPPKPAAKPKRKK